MGKKEGAPHEYQVAISGQSERSLMLAKPVIKTLSYL